MSRMLCQSPRASQSQSRLRASQSQSPRGSQSQSPRASQGQSPRASQGQSQSQSLEPEPASQQVATYRLTSEDI